ncbi:Laccase [Rhynchospora pubera]|uniref:Laccase n=1 Tax=Rhynchospora pubera TaxID=906938 RepID=A0AAV8CUN1_9POAL|nr:Laccase [Rhynchospora pubera]
MKFGTSLMTLFGFCMLGSIFFTTAWAETHHHTFIVKETPCTRLCHTKNILTVNGQFPGPTIYARKGDTVIVNVINQGKKNITLHWHGVDQLRNPWSDGPEQITQCPIQPGANFTQQMHLIYEEGTLWWHAHSDFDLATVHGPLIIYPKQGTVYPFNKPHKEFTLILGEWWNKDVNTVLEEALQSGGEVQPSDANTINGQPGDFLPCSKNNTVKVHVEQGKTYLLRLINAALSNEFFFNIANHHLTVVGTDGSYTKPYATDLVFISPGQTMDVLIKANQHQNSSTPSRYYIAARPYIGNILVSYDANITTAILEYETNYTKISAPPLLSPLPAINDSDTVAIFSGGLRSLADKNHPIDVPQTINEHMYIVASLNIISCHNNSCKGPLGGRFAASLNNVSFETPQISILSAYYYSIPGVYTTDFPDNPSHYFNFTEDSNPTNYLTKKVTKVKMLNYNTTVEIVFQGTNIGPENHPMHLHGQSFYVVGRGSGNFDKKKDPLTYNLVDPPKENTVAVPKNGWATIRFRAVNPGVWYMHCHVDRHVSWGMNTVFITKNGKSADAKMLPPPSDMPPC